MSGHSHWHSIKHKKGATDAKKSKLFSKVSRLLSAAAKEGGQDPDTNPKLRLAVEKAKLINMPSTNIEKAIKKGIGATDERMEPIIFEAYGPGNVAILIEGITDNKNRAISEIKQVLSQHQGKVVNEGSLRWLFEKRGLITIENGNFFPEKRSELELKIIEAGAEDFRWHDNTLDVYTKIEDFDRVKKGMESQGLKIDDSSLGWMAKEDIEIPGEKKEACLRLFEALDDLDSVQEIYSNLKN